MKKKQKKKKEKKKHTVKSTTLDLKAKSGTAELVVAYVLLNLSHVSVLCTEWGRGPVGKQDENM